MTQFNDRDPRSEGGVSDFLAKDGNTHGISTRFAQFRYRLLTVGFKIQEVDEVAEIMTGDTLASGRPAKLDHFSDALDSYYSDGELLGMVNDYNKFRKMQSVVQNIESFREELNHNHGLKVTFKNVFLFYFELGKDQTNILLDEICQLKGRFGPQFLADKIHESKVTGHALDTLLDLALHPVAELLIEERDDMD